MSQPQKEIVIIGAGVIGCAIAKTLADRGHSAFVLESGPRIAEGVTSRNSGVIHAGIYYPLNSLKAESCIRGRELLYEWCEKKGVPHRKTGKWIVGVKEDEEDLNILFENAKSCGVNELQWKNISEAGTLSEQIKADLAIYSPETGIIDPYELSKSYLDEAETKGTTLVKNAKVVRIEKMMDNYQIHTSVGPIEADVIFNCAGLYADQISEMAGVPGYKIYPWRGDYFKLSSKYKFDELVYPSKKKNAPGLGVHLTIDLQGQCKLGPDVEFSDKKDDFSERPEKLMKFFESASKYIKNLKPEDLSYDTCGIRPKLRSPSDKAELDFVVKKENSGLINLIGIESPGLTSSLALAEKAVSLL